MNSLKPSSNKDSFDISWMQKDARCWIYFPNENDSDIFLKGIIKSVVPLSINKANSRVTVVTENGISFDGKANQLERCRDSNSIQRDLIEMDIINAPEVLMQLKRRLAEHKIHTCLWNSLIIVNPFKLIPDQYSEKCLATYFDNIFIKGEDIRKHEPHIFSFMFQILGGLQTSVKTQVISISGQSGSGKTETNKQALRAISYCSSRVLNMHHEKTSNMETMILKCDPILEVFGNAKTIKNDNSSRFGKLISLRLNGKTMKIYHSQIKNFFLQKSRIISQSPGQRNFHIFYQFISFLSDQQKNIYKMKNSLGHYYRQDDFNYLSQRHGTEKMSINDRQMWQQLNQAFIALDFRKDVIHEIWSIIAAVLLLGNVSFDPTNQSQNEPCDIRNSDVAQNIAILLGIDKKQFNEALVTHRRTIAGDLVLSSLSQRQCREGRDSMAKAIYESLFQWLIEQLNRKLNIINSNEQHVRQIKLLDIYGFEVFDHNSFEQLCVNYTNEKIHKIYLEQVFIHQKNTLIKEGLESIIPKLNFTDNSKIIDLLEASGRSIFNMLDQSCTVNVKDDDFLTNIRKQHDMHEHFPASNNTNLRKSFIIKHTPGDIQYMSQGFRQKNKDLIREDILNKLTRSKLNIISNTFKERVDALKGQANKRFLGLKIRNQVNNLIKEMSKDTDLHFIRCIKPNQQKKPFIFVDRVCFNQIKYLGILDTVQMRKESYHIRIKYDKFYLKYGILENNVNRLIQIEQERISPADCKEMTIAFFANNFINYGLEYLNGKERVFLKMSTQNVLDNLLAKKTKFINSASTLIKVHYRRSLMSKRRFELKENTKMIQRSVRNFLMVARKLRKKRAVKIIQKAWIKYHEIFFARKKRPSLMIFQKYFRSKFDTMMQARKIESIRRCKFLLKSLAQSNKLMSRIENYKLLKKELLGSLYNSIWQKMSLQYRNNLIKYMKGWTIRQKNWKDIKKIEQNSYYRLNMKYRGLLENYLRGFLYLSRHSKTNNMVIKIQSYFRMFKVRHKYNSLRKIVIKIQRNWRKYFYDKQANLRFTENYYNNQEDAFGIRNQREYWNNLLFRNVGQSSKTKERGIEKILYLNEKVKQDKISLFYYLIDFEILTKLNDIYPEFTWIQNYLTLYQNAWQKGNPIQTVQVSDQGTICTTINKIYTWGDYSLDNIMKNETDKFNSIKPLAVPTGKLEKVHAHNKFTVVECEGQEPFVVGDARLYSQDSSSKQWKTLNQSFVLVNGIVLTLKKIQFSRVPITQKIVQLSCGMDHCVAKTSLRKIYTWGNNNRGQLGLGHFKRIKKPKTVDYFKQNIVIQQVAASAYGSIALDSNGKLYWWGENGSISNCTVPRDVMLFQKSEFIDNPQKYSVVRILTSWSKSISLIGVTIANHEGIFKSSQNNIKKKTFQNLMNKWNEDISLITPPYIQSISGYFQEKLMPKSKQIKEGRNKALQNQRIRQKLMAEITLMEEAQRTLLQEYKKF